MGKKDLEKKLYALIPELYSFAFSIIAEELQAEQIVMDAIMLLTAQDKGLLKNIIILNSKESQFIDRERMIKEKLYYYVYKVASKRYSQLSNTRKYEKDTMPSKRGNEYHKQSLSYLLNELSAEERALLYLQKSKKISLKDIYPLLENGDTTYLEKIQIAKNKLISLLGHRRKLVREVCN